MLQAKAWAFAEVHNRVVSQPGTKESRYMHSQYVPSGSGLGAPLADLRAASVTDTALDHADIAPQIWWHMDVEAEVAGTWRSPRGRLLEIETQVTTPGGFLALHLRLPMFDLMGCDWFGFVGRTAAAQATVTRACLRSGRADGSFQDQFFARHILSQSAASDHHDFLVPAQCPDLAPNAPWREFVLFLPSTRSITWALHDLRLITL